MGIIVKYIFAFIPLFCTYSALAHGPLPSYYSPVAECFILWLVTTFFLLITSIFTSFPAITKITKAGFREVYSSQIKIGIKWLAILLVVFYPVNFLLTYTISGLVWIAVILHILIAQVIAYIKTRKLLE